MVESKESSPGLKPSFEVVPYEEEEGKEGKKEFVLIMLVIL